MHVILSVVMALGLLLSGIGPLGGGTSPAYAGGFYDAKVDPALAEQLSSAAPEALLEVVIVFSDVAAAARVGSIAATFYQMQALPMAGAVLTRAQIEDLINWPEIYSITLNQPLEYFLHESVEVVRADEVWTTYGQTGGNATVAVVDSGIDATHPDLQLGAKVIQNVKVLPFDVALEDQPLTDTSSGHGTHVASTIGGTGAASEGYYRGVAPDAKLVGLGAGEAIAILTAVQAYDWILQNHQEYNIRVVNNSWGSTGGEINVRNPVVVATYAAYQRGILSVFAAGNDGGYDVMNPYSLAPWLLSVAAGRKDGSLADFSSRGKDGDYFKHPDITAPGVDIFAARSAAPGAANADVSPNPVNPLWTPYYLALSGTSMATPHVAGAAALLFSSNPQLSPDQVMEVLTTQTSPMPAYALHEAGYGYLDALAAYEASRSVTGNLEAFLAGEQQHSPEDVLGFDPDAPVEYDEYLFTGLVPVGVTAVSAPIDHPFEVGEGVQYVDVRVTWTPQAEDALDMEVIDPQGRVVVSSGNGLEEGEAALFVPAEPGTYRLRLYPFAAAAAQYEARVKIAYGTPPADWPPHGEAQYERYVGITGIYHLVGFVGFPTEYYRAGEEVWVNFLFKHADGTAIEGAADQLQVVLTDRQGNSLVSGPGEVFDDGGGEYSYFIVLGNNVNGLAPGPIDVQVAYTGGGSTRSVPGRMYLNHLATTLSTAATSYQPGDTIAFQGSVAQVTVGAGTTVENSPLAGALVTVQLVDADGNRLASTQAQTDLEGNYSGTLAAPGSSRGQVTLLAEATYTDPATVIGPAGWYGQAKVALTFPGNMAPSATLYASPGTSANSRYFVHIEATASDPDGIGDITTATVVLADAKGRVLRRWTLSDFTAASETSLELETGYRVSGSAPWTVTLTVADQAGESATATAVIHKR